MAKRIKEQIGFMSKRVKNEVKWKLLVDLSFVMDKRGYFG